MPAKQAVYLGVDIGGTKVAAGLVDARGKILCKARVPMSSRGSETDGLKAVEQAIEAAVQIKPRLRKSVAAIGISSPGPLDPRAGIIINPPNLPCWHNLHITKQLKTWRKLPIHLDNDANAAALAEAIWGAGQGYDSVFYATLGTGIGTGVIFGGKIYHGRTGSAAEGGHLSIDYHGAQCMCGKMGCIEALAAGPAVAKRAREKLLDGSAAGQKLLSLAAGNPQSVSAEMVGAAWHAGDALAASILQETATLLAIWLGNIIDLLEPDVIIFGGGMGALMSEWFDYIRKRLPEWTINSRCAEIPLVRAHYGEDSGIAGAAALCLPKKNSPARTHALNRGKKRR
jgi:glucokinase